MDRVSFPHVANRLGAGGTSLTEETIFGEAAAPRSLTIRPEPPGWIPDGIHVWLALASTPSTAHLELAFPPTPCPARAPPFLVSVVVDDDDFVAALFSKIDFPQIAQNRASPKI